MEQQLCVASCVVDGATLKGSGGTFQFECAAAEAGSFGFLSVEPSSGSLNSGEEKMVSISFDLQKWREFEPTAILSATKQLIVCTLNGGLIIAGQQQRVVHIRCRINWQDS